MCTFSVATEWRRHCSSYRFDVGAYIDKVWAKYVYPPSPSEVRLKKIPYVRLSFGNSINRTMNYQSVIWIVDVLYSYVPNRNASTKGHTLLSTKRWLVTYRKEAANSGSYVLLLLTGGEPLLYLAFWELWRITVFGYHYHTKYERDINKTNRWRNIQT